MDRVESDESLSESKRVYVHDREEEEIERKHAQMYETTYDQEDSIDAPIYLAAHTTPGVNFVTF